MTIVPENIKRLFLKCLSVRLQVTRTHGFSYGMFTSTSHTKREKNSQVKMA